MWPWMSAITREPPAEENDSDWMKVVKHRKKVKVTDKNRDSNLMAMEEEWETVRVEGLVDSGAIDTIGPKDLLGAEGKRDDKMMGTKYYDVKGGVITNMGGVRIKGKSDDGVPIELPTQVGDKVRRLLIAINNIVAGGNMVVFGAKRETLRKLAESI